MIVRTFLGDPNLYISKRSYVAMISADIRQYTVECYHSVYDAGPASSPSKVRDTLALACSSVTI